MGDAAFELRTIEESYLVEGKAAKLADEGNVKGARDLLTEFVEKKSNVAVASGQQMLDFLKSLPILGKEPKTGLR